MGRKAIGIFLLVVLLFMVSNNIIAEDNYNNLENINIITLEEANNEKNILFTIDLGAEYKDMEISNINLKYINKETNQLIDVNLEKDKNSNKFDGNYIFEGDKFNGNWGLQEVIFELLNENIELNTPQIDVLNSNFIIKNESIEPDNLNQDNIDNNLEKEEQKEQNKILEDEMLSAVDFTIDKNSGVAAGTQISMAAKAIGGSNAEYQYWVKDKNGWQIVKDYSKDTTFKYIPKEAGEYRFTVRTRTIGSKKPYEALKGIDFKVEETPEIEKVEFELDKESGVAAGTEINMIANAIEGNTLTEYQYWVKDKNGWQIVKDYSKDTTFKYIPKEAGDYRFTVRTRTIGSKKEYEALKGIDFKVEKNITSVDVILDKNENISAGSSITMTVKTENINSNIEYQYWMQDRNGWKIAKDFNDSNKFTFTTSEIGHARFTVRVRTKGSSLPFEELKGVNCKVSQNINSVKIIIENKDNIKVNSPILVNTELKSSNSNVEYQYWVRINGKWIVAQDFSTQNTFKYTPKVSGSYRITVRTRTKGSSVLYEALDGEYLTVKSGGLYGKIIMLDPGHGGIDPGAVNHSVNMKEKDLNNSLTKKIYEKLKGLGAKVIFTRETWNDKFVHLHDRTALVNKKNPDLLLSIHHDSSTNKSMSGISVHYSSYRPGLNTSGSYVKYNGKEYKFIREIRDWYDPQRKTQDPGIVIRYGNKNKTVNINDLTVYDDRSPTKEAIESEKLANFLYASLLKENKNKKYNYIKDHNLHMTRWSNVPTALIEAGFLSNDSEARRLSKSNEQNKTAERVVEAIKLYFQ